MRSIKLFGLAFAAILAACAVSAASSAATEVPIAFSKTGTFSGESTTAQKLEVSNGKIVECTSATTKGEITSEDHGLELVLFEKCTLKTTGTPTCKSEGAPSGEILIAHLLILLGSDKDPTTEENLNPAVLLEPSPDSVSFKCELLGISANVTVTGSVICSAQDNSAETGVELLCEKGSKAGEQKDKRFWDASESEIENILKATSTGAESFSNLETALIGTTALKGPSITLTTGTLKFSTAEEPLKDIEGAGGTEWEVEFTSNLFLLDILSGTLKVAIENENFSPQTPAGLKCEGALLKKGERCFVRIKCTKGPDGKLTIKSPGTFVTDATKKIECVP